MEVNFLTGNNVKCEKMSYKYKKHKIVLKAVSDFFTEYFADIDRKNFPIIREQEDFKKIRMNEAANTSLKKDFISGKIALSVYLRRETNTRHLMLKGV